MEANPETNAALRLRFEQLLGDYEVMRRDLAAAQKRMREATGTAQTSDKTVHVTVDFRGRLTGLRLEPRAYSRYSPTLLGEQILRLVDEACDSVHASMAEVMAPFIPDGVSYADLVSGTADPATLRPDGPLTDENYDRWRARFRRPASGGADSDTDGGGSRGQEAGR